MRDSEVRRRERQRSGGSTAEAALHLKGRLRRGELTEEGLEIAARCGDKAAALVWGRDVLWPDELGLTAFLASLPEPAFTRALLAGSHRVLSSLVKKGTADAVAAPDAREFMCERLVWQEGRRQLAAVYHMLATGDAERFFSPDEPDPRNSRVLYSLWSGPAAGGCRDHLVGVLCALTSHHTMQVIVRGREPNGDPAEDWSRLARLTGLCSDERILRTMRKQLLPWALGEGDPVLDRVAKGGTHILPDEESSRCRREATAILDAIRS